MTDYASFYFGAVRFPLPHDGTGLGGVGASTLRDADPVLFYLLEYGKAMLERHMGGLFMANATVLDHPQLRKVVAETLPLNPEQYLVEGQFKFPLLCAYPVDTKPKWIGRTKHAVDEIEMVYVLPPLEAGEAERMLPFLRAAFSILDNRIEQGRDPSYTPTEPTGTANDSFWERAGLVGAGVVGARFGGFAVTEKLFYPAVTLKIEATLKSTFALDEFEEFEGADADVDVNVPTEGQLTVAEVSFSEAPTLTLAAPNSGTKAGGTAVTLTGTNLQTDRSYTITIGGVVATTSAAPISATQIQFVTPAHTATPTFIADVILTDNIDGQSGTLVAGFTFTTP